MRDGLRNPLGKWQLPTGPIDPSTVSPDYFYDLYKKEPLVNGNLTSVAVLPIPSRNGLVFPTRNQSTKRKPKDDLRNLYKKPRVAFPTTKESESPIDDDIEITRENTIQHNIDRSFEAEQRTNEVIYLMDTDLVDLDPPFAPGGPEPVAPFPYIPFTDEERKLFPSYMYGKSIGNIQKRVEPYQKAFARLELGNQSGKSKRVINSEWQNVAYSRDLNLRTSRCIKGNCKDEEKWLTIDELAQGLRLVAADPRVWVPLVSSFTSKLLDPGKTYPFSWHDGVSGSQRKAYDSHDWIIIPSNTAEDNKDKDAAMHWQLLIYNKANRTIYFGDSLGTNDEEANTTAVNFRLLCMQTGIEDPGLIQVVVLPVPKQAGGWQCGYEVIESARAFVRENGLANWHRSSLYNGMNIDEIQRDFMRNIDRWSRIGYRDHHDLPQAIKEEDDDFFSF